MNNIRINNLVRVSKRTARSMYKMNFTIELIPRLINPRGMWMQGHSTNRTHEEERDFDHIINAYEYYNCNNETGLYTAYYVDEGDLLRYRINKRGFNVVYWNRTKDSLTYGVYRNSTGAGDLVTYSKDGRLRRGEGLESVKGDMLDLIEEFLRVRMMEV